MTVYGLKIAIFVPSLEGGGAEKVMLNLAEGFVSRGHAVDLVLSRASGPLLAKVPSEVRVVDLKAGRVLKSVPGLVKYLKKESPDILFSTLDNANIVSILSKLIARASARVIVREANTFSLHSKQRRGFTGTLFFLLVKFVYPLADEIVAVSNGVAEDLSRSIRIPREKIKVIYNPILKVDDAHESGEIAPHRWLLSGESPVIIGAGSLEPQKDFATLIRAFNVARNTVNCRLIILGEGSQRGELEQLISTLGVENQVCMPGFVPNPKSYMQHAALFVLSSAWEGMPNVLLEALACGCPVISTDCPSGPGEILQNGKYGELVPVGDIESMASSIKRVLAERSAVKFSASRLNDFSLDKISGEYLRLMG